MKNEWSKTKIRFLTHHLALLSLLLGVVSCQFDIREVHQQGLTPLRCLLQTLVTWDRGRQREAWGPQWGMQLCLSTAAAAPASSQALMMEPISSGVLRSQMYPRCCTPIAGSEHLCPHSAWREHSLHRHVGRTNPSNRAQQPWRHPTLQTWWEDSSLSGEEARTQGPSLGKPHSDAPAGEVNRQSPMALCSVAPGEVSCLKPTNLWASGLRAGTNHPLVLQQSQNAPTMVGERGRYPSPSTPMTALHGD